MMLFLIYLFLFQIKSVKALALTSQVQVFTNISTNNYCTQTPEPDVCDSVAIGGTMTLTAPAGMVFVGVVFASFGNPVGSCGTYSFGTCHAPTSDSAVFYYCYWQASCTIPVSTTLFGDPCASIPSKKLVVQLSVAAFKILSSVMFTVPPAPNNGVVIYGTDARYLNARGDIQLLIDGQQYAVDCGVTHRSNGARAWESSHVFFTGYLSPGFHNVSLLGTNVWGCGSQYGHLHALLFNNNTIGLITVNDTRNGCPPNAAANSRLVTYTLNLTVPTVVKLIGHIPRLSAGGALLHLQVNGNRVQSSWCSGRTDALAWQSCYVSWMGTLPAGSNDIYLWGNLANAYGCNGAWGKIEIVTFPQIMGTAPLLTGVVFDAEPGCPPVRPALTPLTPVNITIPSQNGGYVWLTGYAMAYATGRADLRLLIDGIVQLTSIRDTETLQWQSALLNFITWLPYGNHSVYVDSPGTNGNSTWGCGELVGNLAWIVIQDANECLTENGGCDPLTTCTDVTGGVTCGPCPIGYSGTGISGCTDINECLVGSCYGLNATCLNTVGSYQCSCPNNGFYNGTGTLLNPCQDIDECLSSNFCPSIVPCINTIGAPGAYCGPYILPNTLKGNVTNTDGGQTLYFLIDSGNALSTIFTIQNIYFGPSQNLIYYKCLAVDGMTVSGNIKNVSCLISAGVGAGLVFSLQVCSLKLPSCILSTGTDQWNYPPPSITAGTLRFTADPGSATSFLKVENTLGEQISFQGTNFLYDPQRVFVYFGPASNLLLYRCVLSYLTTSTVITCTTQANGEGTNFFTLVCGEQNITGTDVYIYPLLPVLLSIEGCPLTVGNGTGGCPTQGNIPIVLNGTSLYPPLGVFINGNSCPITEITNSTSNVSSIICYLPIGTGYNSTVVVTSGKLFSSQYKLISYSLPIITQVTGCTSASSMSIINCPRSGSTTITLQGENFGESGAIVLIGAFPCTNVSHDLYIPHNKLTCTIPTGNGLDRPILLFQIHGEISSDNAILSYDQCQPGTYQNGTSCLQCNSGYYTDIASSTSCLKCLSGTFSNQSAIVCNLCEIGYYQDNMGQSECQFCGPGQFSDTKGESECKLCPEGKSSNNTFNTRCDPCNVGEYQSSTNASSCERCSPGYISDSTGQASCKFCSPGYFTNINGSTKCIPCDSGFIQPLSGQSSCNECPLGSYNDNAGQSTCKLCSIGLFSALTAQTACGSCGNGTFASLTGTQCLECSIGSFRNIEGSTACQICPQGRFQNLTGQADCLDCPKGKYQNNYSSTSCINCPQGFIAADEGSSNCLGCQTFHGYTVGDGSMSCLICPAGMDCPGGIATALPGFWAYHTESGLLATSKCPNGLCLSNDCGANRVDRDQNPLCGSCKSGYSEWNGKCIPCTKSNIGFIILLLFYSWIYTLLLHMLSQDLRSPLTKIFQYYIAIAHYLVNPSLYWLNWISVLDFNIGQLGGSSCIAPMDAYDRLSLRLFTPLIFSVELWITMLIHWIYLKWKHDNKPFREFINQYITTTIAILLFSYSMITTLCFEFLSCVNAGSVSVVFTIPSIQCGTSQYIRWKAFIIFLIIFFVLGLPLSFGGILYYFRDVIKLYDPTIRGAPSNVTKRESSILARLGILFRAYRSDRYYWEIWVLLRRMLIIAFGNSLISTPVIRSEILVTINLIILIFHMLQTPYLQTQKGNIYETFTLTSLVLLSIFTINVSQDVTLFEQLVVSFSVLLTLALLALSIFRDGVLQVTKSSHFQRATVSLKSYRENRSSKASKSTALDIPYDEPELQSSPNDDRFAERNSSDVQLASIQNPHPQQKPLTSSERGDLDHSPGGESRAQSPSLALNLNPLFFGNDFKESQEQQHSQQREIPPTPHSPVSAILTPSTDSGDPR